MDLKCTKCDTEITTLVKPCERCRITFYCSRDCKKADWKAHKKFCSKRAKSNNVPLLSPPQGLSRPIPLPVHRLSLKIWLHDRPEGDVYRILIDAYRLGVSDTDKRLDPSERDDMGIFIGGMAGFLLFLDAVASRQELLPPWWSIEKKRACLDFGADNSHGCDLSVSITKNDLLDYYGSLFFLVELRIFMQQVTGRGPIGLDTTAMMMAFLEREQAIENREVILAAAHELE